MERVSCKDTVMVNEFRYISKTGKNMRSQIGRTRYYGPLSDELVKSKMQDQELGNAYQL